MHRILRLLLVVLLFGILPMQITAAEPMVELWEVALVLASGYSVEMRNEDGLTALMAAAVSEHSFDVVGFLISKGANLNTQDFNGRTALMYAVSNNENPAIVDLLIDAGADPNAVDDSGWTALMYAIHENKPEMIDALLNHKPNLNIKHNKGLTALMLASGYNTNPEITSKIVAAGAKLNIQESEYGWTALMLAAAMNTPEIVDLLLDAGVDGTTLSYNNTTAFDYGLDNRNLFGTSTFWRLKAYSYPLGSFKRNFLSFLGLKVLPVSAFASLITILSGLVLLPFLLFERLGNLVRKCYSFLTGTLIFLTYVRCSTIMFLALGVRGYMLSQVFLVVIPITIWAIIHSWWLGAFTVVLATVFIVIFLNLSQRSGSRAPKVSYL